MNWIYGGKMRIFAGFLKERAREILLYIITLALLKFVFFLYNLPSDALNYGFLLVLVLAGILFFIDFCEFYKRHKELVLVEKNMQDALLDLPEPDTLIENDYQDLLDKLEEIRRKLKSEELISRQEMQDYYGMWVHQIKTPISAMRMLLQTMEEEYPEEKKLRELKAELFRIEQYVEMVLTYLRMEDMASDLKFEYYPLDDLIRASIRKYSQMFILKKIRLEYQAVNQNVITDKKWLCFVIEQILSNALKYTEKGGTIQIFTKQESNQLWLVIADNGIGIWEEDLPRVFERGFTGYNGRADKKSTGIGLYLCKKVMGRLRHQIRIESKVGVGTQVFLGLAREELHPE